MGIGLVNVSTQVKCYTFRNHFLEEINHIIKAY